MNKSIEKKIGTVLSIVTIGYLALRFILFPLFGWWETVVLGLNHLIR